MVSSEQLGPGQYDVIFSQDVSACALTAVTVGPLTAPDQAFASPYNASVDGVFVEIKDSSTGLRADHNFNVTVAC